MDSHKLWFYNIVWMHYLKLRIEMKLYMHIQLAYIGMVWCTMKMYAWSHNGHKLFLKNRGVGGPN